MSPNKDPASVVVDAQWLPAHWHEARDVIDFAWVPRDRHPQLSFLSDQYLRELEPATVSLGLGDLSGVTPHQAHYIFHSAFCCSTLLTRALDVPGRVMGLNEPWIMVELAAALQQRRLNSDVLQIVSRLLARPFGPGEPVVIKPSNEVNVLAHALLDGSESRALFLYAPLPRFLSSVARKGMWGRIWSRRLFSTLRVQTGINLRLGDEELWPLTDLQVAALAWLMHQAQAAALLRAFPDRVRTLDSETFLANRAKTLSAVGSHFGTELDGETIAAGPAFATHSKEIGRSVDPEEPLEARTPIPTVDEEIEMVATWARTMAEHIGMKFDLPRQSALLGSA